MMVVVKKLAGVNSGAPTAFLCSVHREEEREVEGGGESSRVGKTWWWCWLGFPLRLQREKEESLREFEGREMRERVRESSRSARGDTREREKSG